MTSTTFTLPVLGATAWFEQDPGGLETGFLDLACGRPCLDEVEPLQRRRLSPLARGVLHCAGRLGGKGDLRMVFASRHGESARTLGLLRDLAAGTELSPALFAMSVHNAVPGLLTILRGNHAACTAISAGPESFGYGLLEACAAWKADPGTPLLLIYGEEPLPDLWTPFVPQETAHAVGVLLGEGGRSLTLGWDPEGCSSGAGGQSRAFLEALGTGAAAWAGPTARWEWSLA